MVIKIILVIVSTLLTLKGAYLGGLYFLFGKKKIKIPSIEKSNEDNLVKINEALEEKVTFLSDKLNKQNEIVNTLSDNLSRQEDKINALSAKFSIQEEKLNYIYTPYKIVNDMEKGVIKRFIQEDNSDDKGIKRYEMIVDGILGKGTYEEMKDIEIEVIPQNKIMLHWTGYPIYNKSNLRYEFKVPEEIMSLIKKLDINFEIPKDNDEVIKDIILTHQSLENLIQKLATDIEKQVTAELLKELDKNVIKNNLIEIFTSYNLELAKDDIYIVKYGDIEIDPDIKPTPINNKT